MERRPDWLRLLPTRNFVTLNFAKGCWWSFSRPTRRSGPSSTAPKSFLIPWSITSKRFFTTHKILARHSYSCSFVFYSSETRRLYDIANVFTAMPKPLLRIVRHQTGEGVAKAYEVRFVKAIFNLQYFRVLGDQRSRFIIVKSSWTFKVFCYTVPPILVPNM